MNKKLVMNNEEKILTIIDDLRKADPTVTLPDAELLPLVQELIAAEPTPEIDEKFSKYLRAELVNPAHSRTSYKQSILSPYLEFVQYIAKNSEKFVSAAMGALVALIIAIPGTYFITSKLWVGITAPSDSVKDTSSELSLKQQINDKGTNAFGKLALLPDTATSTAAVSTTSNPASTATPSVATATIQASSSTTTASGTILETPTYTYVGDPITLTTTSGIVFKREEGTSNDTELSNFIKGLGLTNFSSFSNLDLEHVDLSEKQSPGYDINLNFNDGSITISAKDAGTGDSTSATSSTMTDVQIVQVANSFLSDHTIDTSSYGTPYIMSNQKKDSTATVLYPLELAGQDVYDDAGNRYGIQVTVNTLSQKVVLVKNLSSQVYESSNYGLETDIATILSPLTASGTASTSEDQAAASHPTVYLETPHTVLMRYIQTKPDGTSNELYIPALLFPTKNNVKNPVIIPLLKDTLGRLPNPTIYDASAIQSISASSTSGV